MPKTKTQSKIDNLVIRTYVATKHKLGGRKIAKGLMQTSTSDLKRLLEADTKNKKYLNITAELKRRSLIEKAS